MTLSIKIFLLLSLSQANASFELVSVPRHKTSLTECLLEVHRRYVKEGKVIHVVRPLAPYQNDTSSSNLHDLILSQLSSDLKWTIMTVHVNKRIDQIKLYLSKPQKIIIHFSRRSEVNNIFSRIKNSYLFTTSATFLVISSVQFPDPLQVASEVLEKLWRYKVLFAFVMLPNPEKPDNFSVYTWYPFENGNCGNHIHSVDLLDTCAHGKFETSKDWNGVFRHDSFKNCSIPVGVSYVVPLVMNSGNSSKFDDVNSGLELNLLSIVAKALNITFLYEKVADRGEIYMNGTQTGSLRLISDGKIDMAVSGYAISLVRCSYYDCSTFYFHDALKWCVPLDLSRRYNVFNIVSSTSWLLIISIFIMVNILIWLTSHRSHVERKSYSSMGYVLFYEFYVAMSISLSYLPKTNYLRFVLIIFIVHSFWLKTIYQTHLINVLVNPRFIQKYQTMNDIYENDLNTYLPNSALKYFRENKEVLKKWRPCHEFNCLKRIVEENAAVCVRKLYLQYMTRFKYISQDQFYCFEDNIVGVYMNLIMRKGFFLQKDINKLITNAFRSGITHKLQRDISSVKMKFSLGVQDPKDKRLKYKNLKTVLTLFLVGYALSIFIFIIEVIHTPLH